MKYYTVAMTFIIFDVEIMFLVPWAIYFDELALFGFLAMLLFLVNITSPTSTSSSVAVSTGTELPAPLTHTRHHPAQPRRDQQVGLEEKLPSGVLLTTVEGVAGYMRKASFWPATFAWPAAPSR